MTPGVTHWSKFVPSIKQKNYLKFRKMGKTSISIECVNSYVRIRLTQHRSSIRKSTGVKCDKVNFDATRTGAWVSPKEPEFDFKNKIIAQKLEHVKESIVALTAKRAVVFKEDVVKEMNRKGDMHEFLGYLNLFRSNLQKYNNRKAYTTVYNHLRAHLQEEYGRTQMDIREIDSTWLGKLELYFNLMGKKPNTINGYIRKVRVVYNSAIREKLIPNDSPFGTSYKLPKLEETIIERLTHDQMKAMLALQLEVGTHTFNARAVFLLQYHLGGSRIEDALRFKVQDFIDVNGDQLERVGFRQNKTGKPKSFKITPAVMSIIKPFIEGQPMDGFVFPYLRGRENQTENQIKINVQKCTARINYQLKHITKMLNINFKVTTHGSRHAAANRLAESGVDVREIQKVMGHSNIQTTIKYLSKVTKEAQDKAVDKLSLE